MKHRRCCRTILRLLPALLFLFIYGCSPAAPRAERGILDLRGSNFTHDPPAELSGEWAFYWSRLINPADSGLPTPTAYQVLPGPWQAHAAPDGQPYPRFGYASYRLLVLVNPHTTPLLSILSKEQNSAYRLRINGTAVLANGVPGRSKAEEVPQFAFAFGSFPVTSDTLELILTVSNYHFDNGGAMFPLRMGTKENLLHAFSLIFMLQMISLGIMAIFFMQYLAAFIIRPRERGNLLFALYCLCWSCAVVCESADFRLATLLFPHLSFELLSKIYFIALAASLPLTTYFCASLFPTGLLKRSNPILAGLCLAFIGTVLWTDAAVHSHLFPIFITLVNLFMLTLFHALFIALRAHKRGSAIFAIGFALFCAAAINDSLYNSALIQSTFLCTYGAAALILAEALVLSLRHAETARTNENLLVSLKENRREKAALKNEQQRLLSLLADTTDRADRSGKADLSTTEIREQLTRQDEELERLQKNFTADLDRIPADGGGTGNPHAAGSAIMLEALALWESSTGKTRADFAEGSGLWTIQTDHNGWRRTATLDKYMDLNKIPRFPKWRKIIDSAEFALAHCTPGPESEHLRNAVRALKAELKLL